MNPRRQDSGFTLLEIMIAVAIVVMFATVVGINVTRYFNESRIAKAKVDLKSLESALELYRTNCFRYPAADSGVKALVEKPGDCESWAGPYIKSKNAPKDPWGHEYLYQSPGAAAEYDLMSYGPDGASGGGDDISVGDIQ